MFWRDLLRFLLWRRSNDAMLVFIDLAWCMTNEDLKQASDLCDAIRESRERKDSK